MSLMKHGCDSHEWYTEQTKNCTFQRRFVPNFHDTLKDKNRSEMGFGSHCFVLIFGI